MPVADTQPRYEHDPPQGLTLGSLMSEKEFAEFLKVSANTLATWRRRGGITPPHIKWAGRVYYVRGVVNKWLAEKLGEGGR